MSEVIDILDYYTRSMKLGFEAIGKCLKSALEKKEIGPEEILPYVLRCYTDIYGRVVKECALPKFEECLKEPKKCRKEALECAERIVEEID